MELRGDSATGHERLVALDFVKEIEPFDEGLGRNFFAASQEATVKYFHFEPVGHQDFGIECDGKLDAEHIELKPGPPDQLVLRRIVVAPHR